MNDTPASLSIDRRAAWRRIEIVTVWIVAALACLLYALPKGQDVNWDQRNYHFYSVYALLHGRLDIDIMPAQVQTWINPFGEALQYFAMKAVPPVVGSMLLVLLVAGCLPAVYFLTKALIRRTQPPGDAERTAIAALAALGAFFAPLFLSEIGTTFNDAVGALCVLAALVVVTGNETSARRDVACGALLGLALAIKLTNASYVVGWVAALVLVARAASVRPLAFTALRGAVVFLPLAGPWHVYLWRKFGNPIFPASNDVFRSDAYFPLRMVDERFTPRSLADAFGYFPKWVMGQPANTELAFRDIRFAVVLVLLVLVLLRLAVTRRSTTDAVFDGRPALFVVGFFVVSFAAWMKVFGVARYAVTLELLAPLVAIVLLGWLWRFRSGLLAAAAVCVVGIVVAVRPPDWGHAPFSRTWYGTEIPDALRNDSILFVMLSGQPMSYVIPAFPPSDGFVRIEGNMPLNPMVGLGRMVRARIESHDGKIRTLSLADESEAPSTAHLRAFGLAPGAGACLEIVTRTGRLKSCPLARAGE